MSLFKKVKILFLLLVFASTTYSQTADSLGLPGDHLDLYGVLELFKKSEEPEDFEKALNEENNGVNNLDLNEDGEIDYIRVIDQVEGNVHVLVLQVPVSETESQDVAVIEIEKTGNETANVQIIGDEELYGKDYIIEPAEEEASPSTTSTVVVMNVWAWPAVRHIYGPKYVVWVSPWKWRYYPAWWKPWKPVSWRIHRDRAWHYHHHYRPVVVYRLPNAHKVYYKHRVVSPSYKNKHVKHGPGPAHKGPKPQQKKAAPQKKKN